MRGSRGQLFGEAGAVADNIVAAVVDAVFIIRQLRNFRVGSLGNKARQLVFALVIGAVRIDGVADGDFHMAELVAGRIG